MREGIRSSGSRRILSLPEECAARKIAGIDDFRSDDLANQQLLKALCERIGGCATLKLFQDADHSFHVPARTGRKDSEVRDELLDALADWIHMAILGNRVERG